LSDARPSPTVAVNLDEPLGEFLAREGYSDAFRDLYLLPMAAAIWSCPMQRMLAFPVGTFVRFFHNHGLLQIDDRPQWHTVRGGAREYVRRILARLDDVRLGTPVRSVTRPPGAAGGGAVVHTDRGSERFDHVVLACHSDQALSLLGDATPLEREILGAMPYQANDVVLHTDTSVLPRRRRAWGAWNYWMRGATSEPATVTYNMNILQSLAGPRTWCVTLNATDSIDPASIAFRTTYHHPVYTTEGFAAQERHAEISGVDRTHFCGAYWGYGFHEDGTRSGVRVAESFGVTL
jgi:predicted NAD/FAD-binding protein